ncbi:MAG: hypothetical protein ACP5K5_01965 [Candidatus Micrarchaeia archaeon]
MTSKTSTRKEIEEANRELKELREELGLLGTGRDYTKYARIEAKSRDEEGKTNGRRETMKVKDEDEDEELITYLRGTSL